MGSGVTRTLVLDARDREDDREALRRRRVEVCETIADLRKLGLTDVASMLEARRDRLGARIAWLDMPQTRVTYEVPEQAEGGEG
jgi:hypothetical protein